MQRGRSTMRRPADANVCVSRMLMRLDYWRHPSRTMHNRRGPESRLTFMCRPIACAATPFCQLRLHGMGRAGDEVMKSGTCYKNDRRRHDRVGARCKVPASTAPDVFDAVGKHRVPVDVVLHGGPDARSLQQVRPSLHVDE